MCTGVASYHIFLFSVYLTLFEQDFLVVNLKVFLVPTLGVVMVIPIAWLFYRLVEKSALKIGRRLAGRV